MFQVLFLVCNGPLAWSVLAFAQSLVFHSHAHMTSVFIHVSPMLLSHALRWSAHDAKNPPQFAVCDGGCDVGPFTLWSRAILRVYIPWVCGYYAMVFLMMGDYLKRRRALPADLLQTYSVRTHVFEFLISRLQELPDTI